MKKGLEADDRYYSELWNAWSTTALEELISRDIVFRGSIGTAVNGIEEFKQYVSKIRAAFPDFHNHNPRAHRRGR